MAEELSRGLGLDLRRVAERMVSCHTAAVFPPVPENTMLRLHGWQPERSRTIKIIEQKDDAEGAPYLEFRVYRSGMPPAVFGHYVFERSGPGTEHMAITGNSGAEVQGAWIQATSWAQRLGVEFILVIDPDGLFPPEKRV